MRKATYKRKCSIGDLLAVSESLSRIIKAKDMEREKEKERDRDRERLWA